MEETPRREPRGVIRRGRSSGETSHTFEKQDVPAGVAGLAHVPKDGGLNVHVLGNEKVHPRVFGFLPLLLPMFASSHSSLRETWNCGELLHARN
jgi:hypothetical protein